MNNGGGAVRADGTERSGSESAARTAGNPVDARVPNFYVVGAPRCATTFTYTYLSQHSDVFLSDIKEPRYHCRDLDTGTKGDRKFFIRERDQYLSLFRSATETHVGDTCPFNLFSKGAAGSIREMSPGAKIIIQIRNPVDQMYSFHAVRVRAGVEDIDDFEQALAAEEDRRHGRRLPRRARNVPMYQYRAVATFSEQIDRYFSLFPRENVRVVVFDDLVRDTAQSFGETLEFLGLTPLGESLRVVNANSELKSRYLKELVETWQDPLRRLVPRRFHGALRPLRTAATAWNRREVPRRPMDAQLRARLREEFRPEVARLGDLLGRDLLALW